MSLDGFSVIDDEELPFGGSSNNAAKTNVFKQAVCDCPLCKEAGRDGEIFEGERSFYCNNAINQDSRTCTFILYKNNIEKLIRREISAGEVNVLCEEGSFTATCTKINDDSKTYTGIFRLKPMGTYTGLTLSFPD